MWSYVVLRSLISNRLASSCLFLSWLVLSRLSFVFHDERNNCELAERKRNHNTEQHRRNSKSIKNIHKKSSVLGPILSQFWGLGPSWGHLGISKTQAYIPSLIFYRFCVPMGTPLGTQKSHWVPPGGHGSLQRCVFEVSFPGPAFFTKYAPKKLPNK